jgi:glutathione synthase/RimK-type ligase-like ATP-grasp enzyme
VTQLRDNQSDNTTGRLRLAIQPDNRIGSSSGNWYSDRWCEELVRRGIAHDTVDVESPDIVSTLSRYDGLLWLPELAPKQKIMARRMIPVFERVLNGCLFPDSASYWHYDDKIAQSYLLEAAGIPTPRTWVLWSRSQVEAFLRDATYPVVAKLAGGAHGSNVRRLESPDEGFALCRWLFDGQLFNINRPFLGWREEWRHRARTAARTLQRGVGGIPDTWWESHKGYMLCQQYLPGNDWDTRVCVVGDVAWAYRRLNRAGDFRASGSGRFDADPTQIDKRFIDLAFKLTDKLGMQSCAVDGIYRDGEPVIVEFSYAFGGVGIAQCPGCWRRTGGTSVWHQEHRVPAIEILDNLLERVERRRLMAGDRSPGGTVGHGSLSDSPI